MVDQSAAAQLPDVLPRLKDAGEMRQWAHATLEFVARALKADWASFNLLQEDGELVGLGSIGIPNEFAELYHSNELWRIDPLEPARLGKLETPPFLRMGREVAPPPRAYQPILSHFGISDAADMLFRDRGRLIGGISLIWTRRSFRAEGLDDLGETVRRYIEFNFSRTWRSSPAGRRRLLAAELRLTRREIEVVELLCLGRTNSELGLCLGISLPTVKTHLAKLFLKCGVENRAGLVRRVLVGLND